MINYKSIVIKYLFNKTPVDYHRPILGYNHPILFLYIIKVYFISQTLHAYRQQVFNHHWNLPKQKYNFFVLSLVVCRRR